MNLLLLRKGPDLVRATKLVVVDSAMKYEIVKDASAEVLLGIDHGVKSHLRDVYAKDAGGGMMDEALAILAILASHQEGKIAIGQAEPIPVLVEVIRTGSPRNRENGAAVLWSLCAGDVQYLKVARELGAEEVLKELSENGTDRAKRKAASVLELLQRVEAITNPQLPQEG